jgi:uncharacterized damage-inducible protein DinB
MLDYLIKLASHGVWADARLVEAARRATGDIAPVLRELGHIRSAQEIWLSRIVERAPTVAVWPTLSADALAKLGPSVDAGLLDLLGSLTIADLSREIVYTNSTGTTYRTPLDEVLLHLLTHGQYHRGKANALLRASGAEAVNVDVITWLRDTGRDLA